MAQILSETRCNACLGSSIIHDWDCRYLGRTRRYTLANDYVTIIVCEIPPDATLKPAVQARAHVETGHGRSLVHCSKSDASLNALRNAKDLAIAVKTYVDGLLFRNTPFDWPMWWMEECVLEYSARPDGVEIADSFGDASLAVFRFHSHS